MQEKHISKSRRQFLKGAGVVGLASALAPQPSLALASNRQAGTKAKNLIFLVVDGMCHGTLGLAHHWKLRKHGEHLHWMQLYDRPDLYRSLQDTASHSSPVTDSAAAASAWGSGQRIDNGAINVDPKGKALETLYTRAKRAGKKTGLVTTCRITHATPAGFAASVPNRGQEDEILLQYLERGVDVLLGGGARNFIQERDGERVDFFKKFQAAGYRLAREAGQLEATPANGKPLLGVFSHSHIPYAIDRKHDTSLAAVPGLAAMFKAGLKQLQGAEKGFLLQVEAGRVDHAGHANDPGAILHDQLEFDACIPIALDFIEKHPDTLLIVTTDHGTGGCQLDGLGKNYNDSGPALDRMDQFRYSFDWLERQYRASGEFDAELLKRATGISAKPEQAAAIQAAIKDPNINYLTSKIARVFAEELTALSAVGWSSNNHTAECTELLAIGPGAQKVPAFMRNNEVFGIMTEALGI
ncbi:MAG: alkaline phosphatase [Opitutales bacterium]